LTVTNQPKQIRALDRGLDVVEYLSKNGLSSLADLRKATGLSNATLLRVLATLRERGWVRRNIVEGQYELAHALGALLGAHSRAHPFAELAAPILLNMQSQQIGLPSDLCAITGPGRMELIESTRVRGPMAPLRTGMGIRPSVLLSAHGRAALAFASDEQLSVHLEAIQSFGTRQEQQWLETGKLDDELARTRALGFGKREVDYWVERAFDPGPNLGAIAVPVMSQSGLHGTLSILWLQDRMGLDDVLKLGALEAMQQASTQIGKALDIAGHKAPIYSKVASV
jgi:IclR family mhp operon transcriptional activator